MFEFGISDIIRKDGDVLPGRILTVAERMALIPEDHRADFKKKVMSLVEEAYGEIERGELDPSSRQAGMACLIDAALCDCQVPVAANDHYKLLTLMILGGVYTPFVKDFYKTLSETDTLSLISKTATAIHKTCGLDTMNQMPHSEWGSNLFSSSIIDMLGALCVRLAETDLWQRDSTDLIRAVNINITRLTDERAYLIRLSNKVGLKYIFR